MLLTLVNVGLTFICYYTVLGNNNLMYEELISDTYGKTDISCHVVTNVCDDLGDMFDDQGPYAYIRGAMQTTFTYREPGSNVDFVENMSINWVITFDITNQTADFSFIPHTGAPWGSAPLMANLYLRYYTSGYYTIPYEVYLGYYDYYYNNGSSYTTSNNSDLFFLYDNPTPFFIEADFITYDDRMYEPQQSNDPTYQDGYNEGYTNGYNQGKSDGYGVGYQNGVNDTQTTSYNTGYIDGEQAGYEAGSSAGYDTGYQIGKQRGYDEALEDFTENGGVYTFGNLFGAIADTPILYIRQLLGFDVFGVGAVNILMSMITAVVIIWILRKVF